MKFTKEDVVVIAVAEKERNLLEAKAQTAKEMRETNAKIGEAKKDLEKTAKKLVEDEFKPVLEPVVTALAHAGFNSANFSISFEVDRDKQKVNYNLAVSNDIGDQRYDRSAFTRKGSRDFTEELTKLSESLETQEKDLRKKQDQAVEISRALGSLGTVERQAKAAIAKKVLEQSPEGQKLMAALQDIKQLPMA
jgi:hypothetical protein